MRFTGFACVRCGHREPTGAVYDCPVCGGVLDACYDADGLGAADAPLSETFALMPVGREEMRGLGITPTALIRSQRLAAHIGVRELYWKCEQQNLSGSFKDRPETVAVAAAKQLGRQRVIVASSGNAASATAAAAARAGLQCVVLIPAGTPLEKVRQTVAYGAHVFTVEGPYSNCYQLAQAFCRQEDAYNVTTTFLNPYATEGDKLVGYELYEALHRAPGCVYVPVGAGPLLAGVRKGLTEYAALYGMEPSTRMIAVQAEGNSPIMKAFATGSNRVASEPHPQTIAGGIADGLVGYERDGEYTLSLCRASGGGVRAVSDEAIRRARLALAAEEGLFVEPSSAAAVAAVIEDAQAGRLPPEPVVVLLTGHGLKDMQSLAVPAEAKPVQTVSDIADALRCLE